MRTTTHSATPTSAHRFRLSPLQLSLLIGSLILLLEGIFWYFKIRVAYYPVGDDFALLVHSTRFFHPSLLGWFTHGFSSYFNPYPDLSLPYSNFLRPVDNATYYLASLLFVKSWSAYLLLDYAVAAIVTATTFFLCFDSLCLSPVTSTIITLATAASPAYTAQFVYRPSFAFDYLAAMWILLLVLCLVRCRLFGAWCLVCLAVFTKEPAFYTPIAACIAVFLFRSTGSRSSRLLKSGAFLIPLIGLGVLRFFDFSSTAGVYVLSGLSIGSVVRNVVLGATHWPYTIPGEQHIRELTFHNILSLALSGTLWCLVFAAVYYAFLNRGTRPNSEGTKSSAIDARIIVCVFFIGSLLIPVLLDLTPRFGASTFPLLFMVLGMLIAQRDGPGLLRYSAASVLAIVTLLNTAQLFKVFSAQVLSREKFSWALSKDLIGRLSTNTHPVVFLVDDMSENFSSPDFIKQFSGYQGELVPVSNLTSNCAVPPRIVVLKMTKEDYRVRSIVKEECGSNSLYAAYRLDRVSGRHLERDLPEAKIVYDARDRPQRKEEFSTQDLTIAVQPKVHDFAILVPDLATRSYVDIVPRP